MTQSWNHDCFFSCVVLFHSNVSIEELFSIFDMFLTIDFVLPSCINFFFPYLRKPFYDTLLICFKLQTIHSTNNPV